MARLAVVTGGSGFIGRHLVRHLLAEGWRVRVAVRAGGGRFAADGVEGRVVDYSGGVVDPRLLEGCRVLFHVGGVTRGLSSGDFWRGNVEPTRILVRASSEAGVSRFVYVSSQAASGPASSAHDPVTEAAEPHPIEDYGRSKLAAEELVRGGGVPWTIVRPPSVFGRDDRNFAALFRQIRLGVAAYATDPDGLVSVIHISDLLRGMVAAADSDRAVGECYFLTAEPPASWREIYAAAARVTGRRPVEFRLPALALAAGARLGDVAGVMTGRPWLINSRKIELARARFWICSGAKAERELGFRAELALDDGFRDYVDADAASRRRIAPPALPPSAAS